MTLQDLLQARVDDGTVPGAVGLVATGDDVEVAAVGLEPDAIFRLASITKPITAAAVLILLDEGKLALGDEIAKWLPELANPQVVRTPASPIDDVVPANRPITVADLLTFRAGYGFGSDFALPAFGAILGFMGDGRDPSSQPTQDEWLARLAELPMAAQPGEQWLYNTCSDLQGVLVSRVSGQPFADFLAERVFTPLGMVDTGFFLPGYKIERMPTAYQPDADGALTVWERPGGRWRTLPAFASGAGGLAGTAEDYLRFGRMLLAGGGDVLSAESVRLMTTNHLTQQQSERATLFLEGQGWGYGGSVDVADVDPWNVPGRYGWVGGTGTTAHVVPATNSVQVLLTQVSMTSPTPQPIMREFWRYAAGRAA
ncbi:MAG TPA: serine hydrolase domain-containing protein [Pseudonocardiaceae bacterium]|nr:serine hydrolase domain-containing protein [Pseudonocardiaceae bacterium]